MEPMEPPAAAALETRPDAPDKARQAFALQIQRIQKLVDALRDRERELEALEPATETEGWMDMAAAAKVLAMPGYGRNRIFSLLRRRGVLRGDNTPYQRYMDRGYFKIAEWLMEDAFGRIRVCRKTLVSNPGLEFIRRVTAGEGAE